MSFGPLDGKTALASLPLGETPGASTLVSKLADKVVPTAVDLATQGNLPPAAAQLAQTAIGAGLGAALGTNSGGDAPAAARSGGAQIHELRRHVVPRRGGHVHVKVAVADLCVQHIADWCSMRRTATRSKSCLKPRGKSCTPA